MPEENHPPFIQKCQNSLPSAHTISAHTLSMQGNAVFSTLRYTWAHFSHPLPFLLPFIQTPVSQNSEHRTGALNIKS